MVLPADIEERISALDEGRAFVDRSTFRFVEVSGGDAVRWLNDLLTANVERPVPTAERGAATRSLLLTPTGRIRADVHVVRTSSSVLLVQDPAQPEGIDELLAPYVLSSDVVMRSVRRTFVCLPGRAEAPGGLPTAGPSMLGEGLDVLAAGEHGPREIRAALGSAGLVEAGEEAVETWRIRRGVPRFPLDVGPDSLPAEGGLETVIDATKGCFLGQEAVAKVRNLGHPTRVVVALRAADPVEPGTPLIAGGEEVGSVTSAARDGHGSYVLLARVRWESRHASLATSGGLPLERRSV